MNFDTEFVRELAEVARQAGVREVTVTAGGATVSLKLGEVLGGATEVSQSHAPSQGSVSGARFPSFIPVADQ